MGRSHIPYLGAAISFLETQGHIDLRARLCPDDEGFYVWRQRVYVRTS